MSEEIVIDREKLAAAAEIIPIAEHVYNSNGPLPAGWKKVDQSTSFTPKNKNFFAVLYQRENPEPGEARYAVAFRGASSFKVLSSLFSILSRRVPNQHHLALSYVSHVMRKYNIQPEDMELTGHSLGGYLARSVGEAAGVKGIWAFNSPGPTSKIRDAFAAASPRKDKPPAMMHVRSRYDIISKWGYDHGTLIDLDTDGYHHGVTDLRKKLVDILENKAPAAPAGKKKRSLSSIFNDLSRRATASRKVQKMIIKLFYDGTQLFR